MKLLEGLAGCDPNENDTMLRLDALSEVLNTETPDAESALALGLRLYDDYQHGRDGYQIPPNIDDEETLQFDFRLLRLAAIDPEQELDEDTGRQMVRRIQQLSVMGCFYETAGEFELGQGQPSIPMVFLVRAWPDGMDADSPHATASKITADVFQTILEILNSHDDFRIFQCGRERCRRWVVARHDGREYCSDNCRKLHWIDS